MRITDFAGRVDAEEPVTIMRLERQMRGGSQARLVCGDDGYWYVAKFAGNPQGTQTLINEWIAHQVLECLGVSTPCLKVLDLPTVLHSEICFLAGRVKTPVKGNAHLGSRCPVNPMKVAIFDALPTRLIPMITNLGDFATMLVFDQLMAQTDARQAIFVRDRSVARGIGFRAHFIDNGMIFGGAVWKLTDAASHGIYFRSQVYSHPDLNADVETALCRVETITEAALLALVDSVPGVWFGDQDRKFVLRVLEDLRRRQSRIRTLVHGSLLTLNLSAN